MINQVKLRGYKFLIEMERITVDDVPEPYKQAILDENAA
ncbi:Uncharacterised protein [Lysinibacillus sphaericus]|nr:Uncharacterised protein [Lysinibacillus sphaericus]